MASPIKPKPAAPAKPKPKAAAPKVTRAPMLVREVNDPEEEKRNKRWKAESDMRILVDAEEIKSDKARLKAAKGIAKDQVKKLAKVSK